MNPCICNSNRTHYYPLILICVVLSLSACADKAALRDKQRARYDNLESELISAQEAKDRRLRAEYRTSQERPQSDSKKSVATDLGTTNDDSKAGGKGAPKLKSKEG